MEVDFARFHVNDDKVPGPGSPTPFHDGVMPCKVWTLCRSLSNPRSELKLFLGSKNWSCGFSPINLGDRVLLKTWKRYHLPCGACWLLR